nr:DUF2249 domain-containing protein [Oricola nitratireducens]
MVCVFDLSKIRHGIWHAIIRQLFPHLKQGQSLYVIVHHNPRPMKSQLTATFASEVVWNCLYYGPDIWRARINRETME